LFFFGAQKPSEKGTKKQSKAKQKGKTLGTSDCKHEQREGQTHEGRDVMSKFSFFTFLFVFCVLFFSCMGLGDRKDQKKGEPKEKGSAWSEQGRMRAVQSPKQLSKEERERGP